MLLKFIYLIATLIDIPLYALWRAGGWDLDNELPDEDKFMLAMGYHTSINDYFHSIPPTIHMRRRPRIMMKKELLNNPIYGWLLRLGGGFGVDRSRSHNYVQTLAEQLKQEDRLVMIIAPEGTRKHTDDWKTGFYHIAVSANLPLVLAYLDYDRKRIGFSEVYHPTGDIIADYQWMRDFFAEHGSARFADQFALPDMEKLRARVSKQQSRLSVANTSEEILVDPTFVTT